MPTADTQAASERGEIVLGGCRISDSSPRWQCRLCRRRWGEWGSANRELALSPVTVDSVVAQAARCAASMVGLGENRRPTVDRVPGWRPDGPLEEQLRAAFVVALDKQGVPPTRLRDEDTRTLHDWRVQPRGFDLLVADPTNNVQVAAEMKVDDVDQTLWDIFKLTSFPEALLARYLIVIGPRVQRWDNVAGGDFFQIDGEWYVERDTARLFKDHRKAWTDLLDGGSGRLRSCPRSIRTRVIARAPLTHWAQRELRVARVEYERGDPVMFGLDGWPLQPDGDPPTQDPPTELDTERTAPERTAESPTQERKTGLVASEHIEAQSTPSGAIVRYWEHGRSAPTTYYLICRRGEWLVDRVESIDGRVLLRDPPLPLPAWGREKMLETLRRSVHSPCNS